jgi:hypothetical protein
MCGEEFLPGAIHSFETAAAVSRDSGGSGGSFERAVVVEGPDDVADADADADADASE